MDPSDLPAGSPLLSVGPWHLWAAAAGDTDPRTHAWLKAFEHLFPACAAALQARWRLPEGVGAHVVLAGAQINRDWNVSPKALGFHAVAARVEEGDESWLDLPDHHQCYVNLPNHVRVLDNSLDDEASRLAGLMTLPHEMAHVALFARAAGGRTPLEVFDEDGGETGLRALLAHVEAQAHTAAGPQATHHGHHEDEAEAFAGQVVDAWAAAGGTAWLPTLVARRAKARRQPG